MSKSSIVVESEELNEVLNKSSHKPMVCEQTSSQPEVAPPMNDRQDTSGMIQWTTTDGISFYPAGKTVDRLTPGLYQPSVNQSGYYLKKLPVKVEGLLRFPETNSERVINDIKKFWDRKSLYHEYGLTYKRGILLWGPPGSGKSSTIQLILADVIERGGVAIVFSDPFMFIECMRIFREIQPNTPVVVLMEDIDSILENYSETYVLNILDGVEKIDNTVFLATTNYPEKLGERIVNRPSRFDKRFKMPSPGAKSRRIYFEHLLTQKLIDEYGIDIDKWVEDTKHMSIAHLKELFTSVCIFGEEYEETIQILKSMEEKLESSDAKPHSSFGFTQGENSEDEE